jgi:hypothetical protein
MALRPRSEELCTHSGVTKTAGQSAWGARGRQGSAAAASAGLVDQARGAMRVLCGRRPAPRAATPSPCGPGQRGRVARRPPACAALALALPGGRRRRATPPGQSSARSPLQATSAGIRGPNAARSARIHRCRPPRPPGVLVGPPCLGPVWRSSKSREPFHPGVCGVCCTDDFTSYQAAWWLRTAQAQLAAVSLDWVTSFPRGPDPPADPRPHRHSHGHAAAFTRLRQ